MRAARRKRDVLFKRKQRPILTEEKRENEGMRLL
jgi:hypothetical protein